MKPVKSRNCILATMVAGILALTTAPAPADPSAKAYQEGLAAEKAGDPASAKAAYLKALKLNPKNANAQYRLGQVKIHYNKLAAQGREKQLTGVVIPEYNVADVTLKDALDALGLLTEKASGEKLAPNFIVQDPDGKLAETPISLRMRNVPASGILRYLLDSAKAKARYDEHAIVILPR